MMTLDVVCGNISCDIKVNNTGISTPYSAYVDNPTAMPLGEPYCDYATDCPITGVFQITQHQNLTHHPDFNNTSNVQRDPGTGKLIAEINKSDYGTYIFYLRADAEGSEIDYFEYQYDLQCHSTIPLEYSSSFPTYFVLYFRNDGSRHSITFPAFFNNYSYPITYGVDDNLDPTTVSHTYASI